MIKLRLSYLVVFFIVSLISHSKEFQLLKTKNDIVLKSGNSNIKLKGGNISPLYLIEQDTGRSKFKFFNGIYGIDNNAIYEFLNKDIEIESLDIKDYTTIENEYKVENVLSVFNKNKKKMSKLEEFLFMQKIIFLSLKLENNDNINKVVHDYFSQKENINYYSLMFSIVALRKEIITYNPLLVLIAFPENTFFSIKNQEGNQDYKITKKYDVNTFIQIVEEQLKFKDKEKVYSDLIFALDSYFSTEGITILRKEIKNNKELSNLNNYLEIIHNKKFDKALEYLSNQNPIAFKYGIIANYSTTQESLEAIQKAVEKENRIDNRIFDILPYSDFSNNIAKVLNELTKQSIEAGKNKTPEKIQVTTNDLPIEFVNYLNEYSNLLKLSVMAREFIAFKNVGNTYKNFKFSYVNSIKNQKNIINNIGEINNHYVRELYLLTIARIAINQSDLIIRENIIYEDMNTEMLMLLDEVNYCMALSPLVKSDKEILARYGSKFLMLSIISAKNSKDYDLIYKSTLDYLQNTDNKKYFKEDMSLIKNIINSNRDYEKNKLFSDFENRINQ